jgi:2-polyprenyl-6-methoxyphenol hydroxylase-like FAD-dependent oxidoreductase
LGILIVGRGIAGLTLNALLRQRGYRPLIIEKAQEYGGGGGRSVYVMLESKILRKLGNILIKHLSAERFLGSFLEMASEPI